jgi:hypothetical protein
LTIKAAQYPRYGGLVKKPKLLDLFGLSGDPSDHDRLDELFLRLESDTPAAPRESYILIEKRENSCTRQFFPTSVCASARQGRLKLATRSISRRFRIRGMLRSC